jgi:S1-C subfamily serine protease
VTGPAPHRPGHFEIGGACPHCSETLDPGVPVVSCPKCGITQHQTCWALHGGCGSYHCLAAERFDARGAAPDLVISAEDLETVPAPVAAGRPGPRRPPPPPAPPERTSRLAIWSFGLGLAGFLLVGCPGVLASVLGGIALAQIGASRGRLGGTGFAVAGIATGILAAVGWLVVAAVRFDGFGDPFAEEFPREIRLEGTPEPLAAALRRNVLVRGEAPGAFALFGGRKWLGSGVVLRVKDGRALVATNRHVALGEDAAEGAKAPVLKVKFVGGEVFDATIRWTAPGGVDLALLECEAPSGFGETAEIAPAESLRVGDEVFAVGSPRGLGWTYTRGVVSGFGTRTEEGGRTIEVIQTQTPISHGSSGGGLYDASGRLVGINTWTASGAGAEGLHFAIRAGVLEALLREAGVEFR